MKYAITLSILLTLFGCHSAKQNNPADPLPEIQTPTLSPINTNLPGGYSQVAANDELVVASMNYKLTLSVRVDGKAREAEAIVWWQAWRNPNPYILTAWEWK
ncbi:MAG: hypothetical protein GXY61_14725 [Lentisphaerae bacterium]|jgi:hypothetical protein|nr:hypothetical protein [Lentisphaerota bacterium]